MNKHYKVKRHALFICAALCVIPLYVKGEALPVLQCPENIGVQQNMSSHPEGWKVSAFDVGERTYTLKGIYFSPDEYPSDSCCDIPSERKTLPHGETIFYFDDIEPKKLNYWYVCGYENTTVVLARKVPDEVSRCEVKYSGFPVQPRVVSFQCFDMPRKRK
jgi:hypothetical protein